MSDDKQVAAVAALSASLRELSEALEQVAELHRAGQLPPHVLETSAENLRKAAEVVGLAVKIVVVERLRLEGLAVVDLMRQPPGGSA